jgi:hypothetical protein
MRGLSTKVSCNESCSLRVTVVDEDGDTVWTTSHIRRTQHTVKIALSKREVRDMPGLTVTIRATDAAGNRTTVTRAIQVTR